MEKLNTWNHKKMTYFLVFILIVVDYALNDQKNVLYAIKLMFIIYMAIRLFLTNQKLSRYTLWAAVFLTISSASILWAASQQIATFNFVWLAQALIIVALMETFIQDKKDIEFLMKSFVYGGILLSLRLVIETPIEYWGYARLGSVIDYNENDLALKLVFSTIMTLYFISINKKKRFHQILLIGFIVIVLFTGSKKAFLGIILGLIFSKVLKLKKNPLFYIYAFIILILVPYGLYYISMNVEPIYNVLGYRVEDMIRTLRGDETASYSTYLRINMIMTGIEMFTHKPLLGYGIGNYSVLSGFNAYAHNNYIEVLFNQGLVGFLSYYSIYIYILISSMRMMLKNNRDYFPLMIITLIIIFEFAMVSYRLMYLHIIMMMCYKWSVLFKKNSKRGIDYEFGS